MQGIINWKRCKRCGKPFDINTSKDLCLECRINISEFERLNKVMEVQTELE